LSVWCTPSRCRVPRTPLRCRRRPSTRICGLPTDRPLPPRGGCGGRAAFRVVCRPFPRTRSSRRDGRSPVGREAHVFAVAASPRLTQAQGAHPHRGHTDLSVEEVEEFGAAFHAHLDVLDEGFLLGTAPVVVE